MIRKSFLSLRVFLILHFLCPLWFLSFLLSFFFFIWVFNLPGIYSGIKWQILISIYLFKLSTKLSQSSYWIFHLFSTNLNITYFIYKISLPTGVYLLIFLFCFIDQSAFTCASIRLFWLFILHFPLIIADID